MFLYNTLLNAEFDGSNYYIPLQLLCFDRLYQHEDEVIINNTYTQQDNKLISDAVGMLSTVFAFNPFTAIKYYSTNGDATDDNYTLVHIKNQLKLNDTRFIGNAPDTRFTNWTCNGTAVSTWHVCPGSINATIGRYYAPAIGYSVSITGGSSLPVLSPYATIQGSILVLPESYYDPSADEYSTTGLSTCKQFNYTIGLQQATESGTPLNYYRLSSVRLECTTTSIAGLANSVYELIPEIKPDVNINDPDDPYHWVDPATIGGGNGAGDGAGIDDIDPALIPNLPQIDPLSGFITMYNPTMAQIKSLADYLWSNAFDIDSFKKLFTDPMQCIIGLGIIPVQPTLGGSKTVHFGDIDSGIAMPYLSTQFVSKDMGSVNISEYIGAFLDYAPYTKIQIYLPYIGIRDLSPDDVMDDSIHVVYHIDCLSGGCACYIATGKKGVIYQYNGSCIANVPLTSENYSGAIQNAVSAVLSGVGVAVGAATGAAPLTAMGTVGLAQSAANTAINSKPTIQRSGNMGGASGLLSVQKPYIIINRPNMSLASGSNKLKGYPCNITKRLGDLSGFTMVDDIQLNNVPCTDAERDELESILKGGVIL